MRDIKVLGIDLAKNVFQLHGTDSKGRCVLRKRLRREQLLSFVANLAPCLIGLEACIGAHYWSRVFKKQGHEVKIMAAHFVKPYVKSHKNDRNDAAGIAEAVTRPDMKFVHGNSVQQQDIQSLHRARSLMLKNRTAQSNQIRGLLAEYGIFFRRGNTAMRQLMSLLEEERSKLSDLSCGLFLQLYDQWVTFDKFVNDYEEQIKQLAKDSPECHALMKIEGIGPLTATAAIATLGDAKLFRRGREVAAWLGLVPKQHSSGEKNKLGGMSKRGDGYLRTLLIHGARAVIERSKDKKDTRSLWINDKKHRLGKNKAAVALANKNARIIWAILVSGNEYRRAQELVLEKAA